MTKRILKGIYNFLEELGRARAASVLAHQGRINEAKSLMISK